MDLRKKKTASLLARAEHEAERELRVAEAAVEAEARACFACCRRSKKRGDADEPTESRQARRARLRALRRRPSLSPRSTSLTLRGVARSASGAARALARGASDAPGGTLNRRGVFKTGNQNVVVSSRMRRSLRAD